MKRALVLLALVAACLSGQSLLPVSRLPACSTRLIGVRAVVYDGASESDCTTGSGTDVVGCWCNGSTWAAYTAGGGGGGGDGPDGCTLLNGSGAPAGGLGVDCDTYFDTTAKQVYGPKASGSWGSGVSYVGITGDAGANGSNGSNGSNGTNAGRKDWYDYNPDAAPTDEATASDEFDGSISGSVWTWGNQGTATDTYANGAAYMDTPQATVNNRMRWAPAPSAVDWTVTSKLANYGDISDGNWSKHGPYLGVGIAVLVSGTIASPTRIHTLEIGNYSGTGYIEPVHFYSNSYTETSLTLVSKSDNWLCWTRCSQWARNPIWLQFRYTASTKVLQGCMSDNGVDFTCLGATATLSAHPSYVGRFISQRGNYTGVEGKFFYFRTRTDADRNLSGQ